jgi:hypothetical protein
MSFLFRDVYPILGAPALDPVIAPQFPIEGQYWNDISQKAIKAQVNGLLLSDLGVINVQQAIAAVGSNSNAELVAATFNIPGGSVNVINKGLQIYAAGLWTTAANTPTLTLRLRLGGLAGVLLAQFGPSTALTTGLTNMPWSLDGTVLTVTTGATGTLEGHGLWNIQLSGTAGQATETSFCDATTAPSATIDLTTATANQALVLTAQFSIATVGNAFSVRAFEVAVEN